MPLNPRFTVSATLSGNGQEPVVMASPNDGVTAQLIAAFRGERGPAGATTESITAGEAISAARVVTGAGLYAQPATYGIILGVAIAAVALGQQAQVRTSGLITEQSWAWTAGQALFAAPNGFLTATAPASGLLRQVATAITATTILVDLSDIINMG